MPSPKVIAAFYAASALILYCAYATLLSDRDLPNPMHFAKRVTR